MIKVLVVDDDAIYVSAVRAALEASNLEFIVVTDSADALEAAIKFQPDVILLDMMMPGLNGNDVLRAIRTNNQTSNIEVIHVTASENIDEMLISVRLHIADFIPKSISITELIEKVKYVSVTKAMRTSTSELMAQSKAMADKYLTSFEAIA
tara:strand:+ start:1385 stop:1837 length:453 start_codon:yes stop_codon:yes gene_type:complete